MEEVTKIVRQLPSCEFEVEQDPDCLRIPADGELDTVHCRYELLDS